jgi:hypothetical protein
VYVELQQENRRVCVVDLNGQQKGCLAVEAETTAAYSESGHLIFSRGATVVAQRFDPERVVLTGAPVVLAEQVVADALGQGSQFAVTGDPPVFSYFSGSSLRMSQFAWFDRGGARLANVGNSTTYGGFDLSVDGRYLVTRQLGQGGSLVIDIERDVATQVSAEGGGRADVVWAPNADRFARLVTGRDEIVEQPAFGGVSRSIVVRSDVRIGGLEQWSRDGRYLIILVQDGAKRRVEAQPTDGGKPIPLVEGTALIDEPRMSPDGKWVTYNSDVTGTNEVYVMPFPPTGQSIRVSTAGGLQGRWRGDSAEIFYLAPDSTLMATSFAPGNPPRIGTPAQLFKTGIIPTYNLDHFDVTANGKRFLIKVPPPGGEPSLLNVVVNWTSALPEK